MSGRPNKEDDSKSSGIGLAAGLALGGVAAAGFLLYKMFSDNKPAPPAAPLTMCRSNSVSSTSSEWSSINENAVTADVSNLMARSGFGNQRVEEVRLFNATLSSVCSKCHRDLQEVVLEPCNHSVCENCAEDIDINCPLCAKQVVSTKPRYL